MSGIIDSVVDPIVRQTRRRLPSSRRSTADSAHGDPPDAARSQLSGVHATGHVPNDAALSSDRAVTEEPTFSSSSSSPASPLRTTGSGRDPVVARQNGFQGLIPLDDLRSEYAASDPIPMSTSPVQADAAPDPRLPGRASADRISTTVDSLQSMALDEAPTSSSNPSYTSVPRRLRGLPNQSPASSIRSGVSSGARTDSSTDDVMSSRLPDDDGMNALRAKVHEIRDMALSSEEKAKKMHALMTADYEKFRSQRRTLPKQELDPRRSPPLERPDSPASTSSTYTDEALLYVTPDDIEPTYNYVPSVDAPPKADLGDDEDEDEPIFGCRHYMRNVKVQCVDCFKWYTCRHCHDEVEDHALIRKSIRNMLCMHCGHAQRASELCRECGEETANYYCDICKLWDNDAAKSIYHCPDCGICRRGEGLGRDYVHCKKCNVCVSINHAFDHRCVERATESDCPICGEWMFSSSAAVVAMKCGHYIHRKCYDEYMKSSYKCPICSRSAVNMELQWRKMDLCLDSQPMPERYRNTKAWVVCNDCTMRSCVPFHWLGNKCKMCDSYNTNQIKLVDEPSAEETDESANDDDQAARAVERAQAEGVLPDDLPPDVLPPAAEDARSPPASATSVPPPDQAPIAASADAETPARGNLHLRSRSDPLGNAGSTLRMSAYQNLGHPSQPLPVSPRNPSVPFADIERMTEAAATSGAPSTAATEDGESEDEFGFWGEGIRPSEYIPRPSEYLPNAWPSGRFFSGSPPRDGQPPPPTTTSSSSDQPSRWALNPTQWRLPGSPGFFHSGQNDSAIADDELQEGAAAHSSWRPSQWRLGSPRFLHGPSSSNETGSTGTRGISTSPSSRSGWPVDPRQWRLGSPKFFGGGGGTAEADEDAGVDDDTGAQLERHAREGTSPPSLWAMRPNFLGRFGSFSSAAARSGSGTAKEEDEEEGNEGGGSEASDDDDDLTDRAEDDAADEEPDEDEDEDELDLIGHR